MDAKANKTSFTASDREIVITRTFDAPRELVWEAWTDPRHVVNWWGPQGFTTTIEKMDVRPGGVWKQTLHGPDGTDYANSSVFQEVVKPQRIVFNHGGGKRGEPGAHFESTWTFEALAKDRTRVTIRMVFPSAAERDAVVRKFNAVEGGNQTLGRLEEYVAKQQGEFVISRRFPVARTVMFQLWPDPAHLQHWWGPKGFATVYSKMDLRPGGSYHYRLQSADGHDMWAKFVYREIVDPERIVFVNSFADENGNVARHPMHLAWPLEMLNTITFTERDGGTEVTVRSKTLNATEEERKTFEDGFGSMQQGWTGTFEKLDTYIPKVGK